MTNEKLVQSPECEDMYEDMDFDHVCPQCSSQLQYDYNLAIETGSPEPIMVCSWCGYTK